MTAECRLPPPEPDPLGRASRICRCVAGLSTAAMILLSWPLWVGSSELPRVPFVRGVPTLSGFGGWVAASALVVSVAMTGLAGRWRPWYVLSLIALVWLVLHDQHRFQPWAYQYAMTGLFLAALPGGEGLKYARWWFAALYLHSGLSKLDVSYCNELGLVFLRTAVSPLGLDPAHWPDAWRRAAVLMMPAGEIALATALLVPKLWRIGRLGAAVLHLALIGVLGPLGLGHSAIVLVWNAAMLAEVWVAFGPEIPSAEGQGGRTWLAWPVKAVFWAGVLLPLGERWGVWDAWPSHALYASHVERVSVQVHESELSGYPAGVTAHVLPGEGPWRVLDLTGWSREARGTPVYPQNRACLGLAEGLAARYGSRLVRVVAFGPADRRTGRRGRTEATGPDAIRRLADGFLLNGHPAREPIPIPTGPAAQ